jgi:hypothetical protein
MNEISNNSFFTLRVDLHTQGTQFHHYCNRKAHKDKVHLPQLVHTPMCKITRYPFS